MIKPEQIPTEAWTAATIRLEALRYVCTGHNIREAIAEAINAWPNASRIEFDDWVEMVEGEIVLPAPEKNND